VGHLHLLAITGFTELAIPAMVVLGFQAHPQFAITETLQWCAELELQRTWVNNFGVVRTLRFVSQCSTFGVSFTFIFMFFLCCRDEVKMCWDATFSSGVMKRVLMSEMPLSLGKGRRSLILKIH